MRCKSACLLLLGLSSFGCDDEDSRTIRLQLTPGLEVDAFDQNPVPTRLVLNSISTSGEESLLRNALWPSESFELPDVNTSAMMAFEALGKDDSGATVLRGTTIFHALWNAADTIPVFVGRVRELSRPSGTMPIAHENGVAGIVDARFIVAAGGKEAWGADGSVEAPAALAVYDLGAWEGTTVRGTLPRSPRTMVMIQGGYGLLIDDNGADLFDFITFTSSEVKPPDGFSFSEVSGGKIVYGEQGEAYVVGATRSESASSAIFRIDSDGQLHGIEMDSPRQGAATVYCPGRGLLVVGGHATEAGVLLLAPDSSSLLPLAYPPDSVQGAAAAVLGQDTIVLAGGKLDQEMAPMRMMDLRCSDSCEAKAMDIGGELPSIEHGWAWGTNDEEVVLIGASESDPQTRLLRFSNLLGAPKVEEVPLKEPRAGATPLALFGRTVAIVGGSRLNGQGALGIEVYVPK